MSGFYFYVMWAKWNKQGFMGVKLDQTGPYAIYNNPHPLFPLYLIPYPLNPLSLYFDPISLIPYP